jgi:hypothetical protein
MYNGGGNPDMGGAYCTGEPAAGTPPPEQKDDRGRGLGGSNTRFHAPDQSRRRKTKRRTMHSMYPLREVPSQ